MDKCDSYCSGRCLGTKEVEACSCKGDKNHCDFYIKSDSNKKSTYDFATVINEYSRMCNLLQKNCTPETCPIYKLISNWEETNNKIWDDRCIVFARMNPNAFADTVMQWAKDNPPKLYPTIKEVITNMAIKSGLSTSDLDLKDMSVIFNTRLTEEAANYFNISAINEKTLKG